MSLVNFKAAQIISIQFKCGCHLVATLEKTEKKLNVKDTEIVEYNMNIGVLEEQIEVLKENIEAKKIINRMPMQEIAEGTQEAIEKLVIQLRDAEDENLRMKKLNEIYEFELKNLQKDKIAKKRPKGKIIDCFDVKVACTQTGIDENLDDGDWIRMVTCLAVGLEDVLGK